MRSMAGSVYGFKVWALLLFTLVGTAQEPGMPFGPPPGMSEISGPEFPERSPEAQRQRPFSVILAELEKTLEAELPDWKAQRQELAAEARKRVFRAIRENDVAAELGIEHPVLKPKLAAAEAHDAVGKAVEEKVNDKFPETPMAAFEQEAAQEIPQWKVGDEVEFKCRNPRTPFVKGKVYEINPNQITVGYIKVNVRDVDESVLAHFHPDKLGKARQELVRRKVTAYKAARFRYETEVRPQVTAKTYDQLGYCQVDGEWQTKRDVVEQKLLAARRSAFPEAMKAVLAEKEFVHFEDDWMPADRAFFLAAMQKAYGIADRTVQLQVLNESLLARPKSPFALLASKYRQELTGLVEGGKGQVEAMGIDLPEGVEIQP